jgi:hypothetical protein
MRVPLSAGNREYLMDDGRTIIRCRQKSRKNLGFIKELVNLGMFDGHFIVAECESGRVFLESKPCDSDLFWPDCHLFRRESPEKIFLRRLNLNKAAY